MWSHRLRFPNDKITLISNFEDFSNTDQEYIIQFCQRLDITLISLNTIESQIKSSTTLPDQDIQLALLAIARLEITLDFGNIAAASDIVRTVSPVTQKKLYSDFDMIKMTPGQDLINAPLGFLLDGYFYHDPKSDHIKVDKLSNAVFKSISRGY